MISVTVPYENVEAAEQWCRENCPDRYMWSFQRQAFRFDDEKDATMVKLKFGGAE